MALIDSADSVLMLHSYAGVPVWPVQIFKREIRQPSPTAVAAGAGTSEACTDSTINPEKGLPQQTRVDIVDEAKERVELEHSSVTEEIATQRKLTVMSGLSIILTMMSILVAFRCVSLY